MSEGGECVKVVVRCKLRKQFYICVVFSIDSEETEIESRLLQSIWMH